MENESAPLLKTEILELFKKEDSMCIIKNSINNQNIRENGFFIELNETSIPFNKCLICCNHLLTEKDIEIGNTIYLLYKNKEIYLEITENRRVFRNEILDYTLIEIFDYDKIKYFFPIPIFRDIDDNYFKKKDVFLLQYPRQDKELGLSLGKIFEINGENLLYNCSTGEGSSGGPILLRNNLFVIGMHLGRIEKNDKVYKVGTSIKSIIEDIKKKSDIFKSIDYKEIYQNLEKIGNGNFGTVFKGTKDKKNWALKIIDKEDMRNRLRNNYNKDNIEKEFKIYIEDKLKNEIEIMRICMKNNNNSVHFHEFYYTEKEYAIVMELCDGNLQNILNKRNSGFNKNEVLDIIKQLNNTFKIMSENRIIHRDLKLENILIKYDDKNKSKFTVKLTDYGVSRKLLTLSQKCNTYSGTIITMAPEILAGEEHDIKCDLWSLGIIIYQLFFKKYPYDGETEVAIYNKITKLGQKVIEKTGDEKFDNLIKKLLVKDPKKRLGWKEYFEDPIFK